MQAGYANLSQQLVNWSQSSKSTNLVHTTIVRFTAQSDSSHHYSRHTKINGRFVYKSLDHHHRHYRRDVSITSFRRQRQAGSVWWASGCCSSGSSVSRCMSDTRPRHRPAGTDWRHHPRADTEVDRRFRSRRTGRRRVWTSSWQPHAAPSRSRTDRAATGLRRCD